MVVFDLRVEAQLLSWMYVVAPITGLLVLAAASPVSVRSRLPLNLSEDVRPLALFFIALLAGMVWYENHERRQAAAAVAQCLGGGCNMVEGMVSHVEPVHQVTDGSRFVSPSYAGYFSVEGKKFVHSPSDGSDYSPANYLRDGDIARVYRLGERIVLVEKK